MEIIEHEKEEYGQLPDQTAKSQGKGLIENISGESGSNTDH